MESHLLMLAEMATLGAASRDGEHVDEPLQWPESANFPDSGHDYVPNSDFDLLVNSTHDYYDRIMAPEFEAEHSYAFNVGDSIRPMACELFDCNVSSIISDGIDEPSTSLQEGANIEVDVATDDLRICEWSGCEWSGTSIDALCAHITEVHLVKGNNKCSWRHCPRPKPFPYRYQLERHLRMHTHQQPFSCSICLRSFASRERLSLHTRVLHNKQRAVRCKFCEKMFGTSADRRSHELRAHERRRVLCSYCASMLSSASALRKHCLRAHTPNI
uniref:C2H2-type domain-containing protein n=2 Tax=Ascaris TaxID=6251 RepID=A0A9J2PCN6_ASCLU